METENRRLSSTAVIVWSIVAVLLLMIANFSLWLNGSLFNRDAFVATTVGVIQTKEVSDAIGGVVVDQAFKNNPIVGQIAGDTIKSAVSGLLGSQTAAPLLKNFAEEANVLLTAPKPQGVKIDISGFKAFIQPMAGVLDKQFGTHLSATPLPNSIDVIKKGDVPSLYRPGTVLLWLGPILGLIGLATIVTLVWRAGVAGRASVLRLSGSVLSIGSLVFIILVRSAKAPVLAAIVSSNVRLIAGSLFDAFAGLLTNQTWGFFFLGLLMVGAGYLLPRARQLPVAQKIRDLKIAS
ncbi:MAG: hypothetical protein Q8L35_06650 [Actinomycetota bacterium]|nr:hypothetical protein [Actinomycetota bacterium]